MAQTPEQSLVCRHCFRSSGLSGALEGVAGRLSGRRSHSQLLHSAAGPVGALKNRRFRIDEDNASFTGRFARSIRGTAAGETPRLKSFAPKTGSRFWID